jgi:predicted Rossmann fold flavoprotein
MFDLIIVGGGAAGFYAAIHAAEANSELRIAILERGKEVLSKVKVSGGGRCNVTHAEFNPADLVKNYPRGEKELLGPFHVHCTGDTVAFFEHRNITLKTEEDGRMFPVTNSSQTIIDCFIREAERLKIQVLKHSSVTAFSKVLLQGRKIWEVTTIKKVYQCKKLLVASGSNPKIWNLIKDLGHSIETPVPSLFTFNIKDSRLKGIQGISANADVAVLRKTSQKVTISLASKKPDEVLLKSEGPALITHWGLSGPAILKLSAWGAKILHDENYSFKIRINWLPEYHENSILEFLREIKSIETIKTVLRTKAVELPRRLWTSLVKASGIPAEMTWSDITKELLQNLAGQLTKCEFQVDGKSTFKEEFVTAGGVNLKEINFKTFESKIIPDLYFAGEVLDIDAITGGFNFQNAWTSGYIAAQAIAKT